MNKANYINVFADEYAFLSNYYKCPVKYNGLNFTSAEAAFHAQKCKNLDDRFKFVGLDPDDSKKLGRKIDLREDWENIKAAVMYEIVKSKFLQNTDLEDKLLATGDAYLVEGTTWNDHFWGICPPAGIVGKDGLNMLGTILMLVRAELRAKKYCTDSSDVLHNWY